MEYLEVCRAELTKGALSFDDDVLEKLQCFNSKISGAGTVASIAAVYLASRYAADPINGVVKAAFSIGSDTDTIASMTGGLLGCINGSDWLSSVRQGIQDEIYVEKIASRLVNGQVDDRSSIESIRRASLKNWIYDVVAASNAREIRLPDLRKAKVYRGQAQVGRKGKFKVEFRKLLTEDGQAIYISHISKGDFGSKQIEQTTLTSFINSANENQTQLQNLSRRLCFGPKLPVTSLEESVRFYKELLGLTIKKKTQEVVVFHQGLVLTLATYAKDFPGDGFRTLLYTEVIDIRKKFKAIQEKHITIVTNLENWKQSNRRFFRCLDPDGNLVEIFENNEIL